MAYFIYILECVNDTFYTGYTTDIKCRYRQHLNRSNKCKYTRSFPPKRLAACWRVAGSLSIVLKIERAIKFLTKDEKTCLVEFPELLSTALLKKDHHKITVFTKGNQREMSDMRQAIVE